MEEGTEKVQDVVIGSSAMKCGCGHNVAVAYINS